MKGWSESSAWLWLPALAVGAAVALAGEAAPRLDVPAGAGDRCVEPVETMRRSHMDFLVHQRDATVHEGIRTRRHSLRSCINCHARRDDAGQAVPINAPGEFCQVCHAYAAVRVDCFGCHATRPDGPPDPTIVEEKRR